jgi:hypothetical protein
MKAITEAAERLELRALSIYSTIKIAKRLDLNT